MKKVRLKKDKVIIILLVLLAILVIILGLMLSDYNVDNKALYGDRLNGIKSVKISKSKLSEIDDNVESSGQVEKVETYVQGRIINSEIFIKNEVSRDDAKNLSVKVLEKLSDDEKKFYDVQIFIDKDDDATFPIIGYRHHNKQDVSWTLDR